MEVGRLWREAPKGETKLSTTLQAYLGLKDKKDSTGGKDKEWERLEKGVKPKPVKWGLRRKGHH